MNEQLQNQLAEIIAAIHRTASAGADFAMAQLPDIAQQYVIYGRVSSTLYVLIGVGMLLLAALAGRKSFRIAKESDYSEEGKMFVFGFFAAIGSVLGFTIAAANLGGALLVWFAPKVWLLKELAGLLK